MWHIEFNLITADPARLGKAVTFIETGFRPEVESRPGSLGITLCVNPELGVAILQSVWAARDFLLMSQDAVQPGRREAVRRAAGTISVERYRVPVFELERPLKPGAVLQVTRMDIAPQMVDDGVHAYGDTVVPWLADAVGFGGALLLADPATGHAISETMWPDPQRLAASRGVAAAARAEMAESAGWVIRAVEEYGLVFSSARKA